MSFRIRQMYYFFIILIPPFYADYLTYFMILLYFIFPSLSCLFIANNIIIFTF